MNLSSISRRRRRRAAVLHAGRCGLAQAQDFPTRPVHHHALPGGRAARGRDAPGRGQALAHVGQAGDRGKPPRRQRLHRHRRLQARASDGHDLIQLDNVHLSAYPSLFKKLPYDPQKDFDPLLPLFKTYFVTTAANGKYRSVGELLADARPTPAS